MLGCAWMRAANAKEAVVGVSNWIKYCQPEARWAHQFFGCKAVKIHGVWYGVEVSEPGSAGS
jgi:hypothetical protein